MVITFAHDSDVFIVGGEVQVFDVQPCCFTCPKSALIHEAEHEPVSLPDLRYLGEDVVGIAGG